MYSTLIISVVWQDKIPASMAVFGSATDLRCDHVPRAYAFIVLDDVTLMHILGRDGISSS